MSKIQKTCQCQYLRSPLSFGILRERKITFFSWIVLERTSTMSMGPNLNKAPIANLPFFVGHDFAICSVYCLFLWHTFDILTHTCFFAWVPLLTGGTLDAVGTMAVFGSSGARRSNLKLLLRYTALSLDKTIIKHVLRKVNVSTFLISFSSISIHLD